MFDSARVAFWQRAGLYGISLALAAGRVLIYYLRLGLYRKHQPLFEQIQPPLVTEGWRGVMAQEKRVLGAMLLSLFFYGGAGFIASFHHAFPGWAGEVIMGGMVFFLLGGFCQEIYYLVNRLIMLRRPAATRRTFMASPRSGLALEAMMWGFFSLPIALACAISPVWHLAGGMFVTGAIFLAKLLRLLTVGSRLAREAAQMGESENGERVSNGSRRR